MKKNSTLLILIPGFAKNENDSTCIPFSQSFIKTLNKYYPSASIIIIALDYPSKENYHWFGNEVRPLNGKKYKGVTRLFKWFKLYRQIRLIHKTTSLLGILSFWCDEHAMIGHYYSKWHKLKHYCWLQGQDAREGNPALKYFRPSADELIALSDSLQEEFKRNYGIVSAKIIPAAVYEEEFPTEVSERTIDIIGVGSLITLKRFDLFIEVIENIRQIFPAVKAVIIGSGSEKERLENLIKLKRLENTVTLLGELDHKEVLINMQQSKILLHTSSYEGYGMVCLEALYAGCQVVSFVSPEKRKIENWHIVDTREAMITKCTDLLNMNSHIYKKVLPMTIEKITADIMQLYTS